MAQVIKTTFKFRRNLASYWKKKNPVLAEGEPCFELDTGKLKIGNGTTAYKDLPYVNSGSVQVEIATEDVIGVMKLYGSLGNNTDGTMNQKVITDEHNQRTKLKIDEEAEMDIFD